MKLKYAMLLAMSGMLSACGGGGGGGGGAGSNDGNTPVAPPVSPPPAPVAQVRLTVDQKEIASELRYGDDYRASLSGSWSATNLGAAQVYLQVSDPDARFAVPGVALAPADGKFSFTLSLVDGLKAGVYAGLLLIRACADQVCEKPYSNSTLQVPYALEVLPLAEWSTYQGNARHDGYVPISLDPMKFKAGWKWSSPTPPRYFGDVTRLNAVATYEGKAFISEDLYASKPWIYAINESDAALVWRQQIAPSDWGTGLSGVATGAGVIYAATTGHDDSLAWAFSAIDGEPVFQAQLSSQFSSMMPPTAFNGSVFINAGYFDGVIFALDAVSGIRKWSQTSGTSEMNTPSSDGEFLYSYGGEMLHRLDPETGEIVARSGFETTGTQSGYFGAPIIGDKGMIVVLRGTGFSGWVFASSEPYEDRYLDGYRASDLSLRWQSVKQYRSFPAAAKGVIYATSNNPKSLDALDEETGQILWSWVPGPSDVTFHRNVVVTDTHVFVSTNRALYAIDLETHKSVWQQATPGMLSISPDRTLYVAEGTTMSSGTIQTYRLK